MKKQIIFNFTFAFLFTFFALNVKAQTLTALQQQNARATGYAIIAARNPGKSFAVNMIKWDGVNGLEYNANHQINSQWHAQAVVKGNYFTQQFDGSDFSGYSTVLVSQSEFDTYKATGTDWWIVCSTLPPFCNYGLSVLDNGYVGIGTTMPISKLSVLGSITLASELSNTSTRPLITANTLPNGEIRAYNATGYLWDDGFIRMSAGGGTNGNVKSYIDLSGFSTVPDMDRNIVIGTSGTERMRINNNGKVGIGTTNPDSKLTVNGDIHATEVRVTTSIPAPDYVFASEYKLKSLKEVEEYINKNSHLPEIPSAKEIDKNGLLLAEMNMSLLKKVEELTIYAINQEKKINEQSKENAMLSERLSRIESQLNLK